LLEIFQDMLESVGYTVLTAPNGEEALQALKSHNDISLLVTDAIMPGGINGYQLAEQCHTAYPKIKILLCSGYNQAEDNDNTDIIKHLLRKPYSLKALTQKVRQILDQG